MKGLHKSFFTASGKWLSKVIEKEAWSPYEQTIEISTFKEISGIQASMRKSRGQSQLKACFFFFFEELDFSDSFIMLSSGITGET